MKLEIKFYQPMGWYIIDGSQKTQDTKYLHEDGIWRKDMWNNITQSYGYFQSQREAQKFLEEHESPSAYSMYDVSAASADDAKSITHIYYYGVDENDALGQAFKGNLNWNIIEVSLVS